MLKKYQEVIFIEGGRRYKGNIIIDDYKIYLKGHTSYVDTYIPQDKITLIKKIKQGMFIQVKPTSISRRDIIIKGRKEIINNVINQLINRLNLKKKFLRSVWRGKPAFK